MKIHRITSESSENLNTARYARVIRYAIPGAHSSNKSGYFANVILVGSYPIYSASISPALRFK